MIYAHKIYIYIPVNIQLYPQQSIHIVLPSVCEIKSPAAPAGPAGCVACRRHVEIMVQHWAALHRSALESIKHWGAKGPWKCWSPGPNICFMYVGWSTCMILYMFYVWLSPRMMISTPIFKQFSIGKSWWILLVNEFGERPFQKSWTIPSWVPHCFSLFVVVLEDVPSGKQRWLLKIAIYSGFSH